MDDYIMNIEDTFENILSKEHYFQSLLQMINSNNLLMERDIENIQLQLLGVLIEMVGYYTKNESSSVRVEIAEQIMLSICYIIGLFLRSQPTIKESIDLVKNRDIEYLFAQGEKMLRAKVEKCKKLFKVVKETRLETENYAYVDTIDYGIPLFFKEYNIRFACHETPGSIDYPLAIDKMELVGIEYIEDYLSKVILENKFCSYFNSAEIKALLKGFNRDSNHMLINIFQLVFVNCLGCILVGKRGKFLEITRGDRIYLTSIMKSLSQQEFEALIFRAVEKLHKEFYIEDKNLIEYINKTLWKVIPEIRRAVEANTLGKIFITLSRPEDNMFKYEDGNSLDDSIFRNITDEIRACSRVEDKIKIIREEFHSLKDLVDLLGADCIFDDEFTDIFKALEDFEVALLANSISHDKFLDVGYGTESEKEWHEKLRKYLENLDEMKFHIIGGKNGQQ